jgi:KipI family sensor histidine kinase inhibitor
VADTALTLTRLGPRALRAEVADVAQALSLAAFARAVGVAAEEVVPGARTVVLEGVSDPAAVEAVLAGWVPGSAAAEPGPTVEVPVTYDGEDLDDVAARWGTDRDGVAERLAAADLVSAFCGFAPGFAYLSGLPAELAVPRLEVPRSRVPAGSVAVADQWCGIYPTASPGGWRLLGATPVTLWDPHVDPPALLAPGTRVRLVPA